MSTSTLISRYHKTEKCQLVLRRHCSNHIYALPLLRKVDEDFFPHLSTMYGDIHSMVDDLNLHNASSVSGYYMGELVGILCYWYDWAKGCSIYVHLLAISPRFRRSALVRDLIQTAIQTENRRGVHIQYAFARTASTNRPMRSMMAKLGFNVFQVVEDDFGVGRISLFYEVTWLTLCSRTQAYALGKNRTWLAQQPTLIGSNSFVEVESYSGF